MNRKIIAGVAMAAILILASSVALAAPRVYDQATADGLAQVIPPWSLPNAPTVIPPCCPAITPTLVPIDVFPITPTIYPPIEPVLFPPVPIPPGIVPRLPVRIPAKSTASLPSLIQGRVQSVSDDVIKLETSAFTRSGQGSQVVDVNTNNDTVFYGISAVTDLKTDDLVAVLLQKPVVLKTLTAKAVALLPEPGTAVVTGKVGTIDTATNSFELTNQRGTVLDTVNANAALIIIPGKDESALSDLKKGNTVIVYGKPTGSKTITADLIVILPLSTKFSFTGIVVSVNGTEIVIWTSTGNQLTVDASKAVFFDPRNSGMSIADIQVGKTIYVIGTRADDTVKAQLITEFRVDRKP